MLLLVGNLERSRVGRAWVAIREDEDAAEIMGVPTYKFKLWAFAIGAAIGGLSGALFAGQVGFVNNQKFDVPTSILFLAAVVLGGHGQQGRRHRRWLADRRLHPDSVHRSIAEYRYLIFGLALIILMIFRPQGLFPACGRTCWRTAGRPIRSCVGGGDGRIGHRRARTASSSLAATLETADGTKGRRHGGGG